GHTANDERHARRTTDEDHMIDVGRGDVRDLAAPRERALAAPDRRLDEVADDLLVVGPPNVRVERDALSGLVPGDVVLRHMDDVRRRQRLLDLLRQMYQPREETTIVGAVLDVEVERIALLDELFPDVLGVAPVEVVAAEVVVAVDREDLVLTANAAK